MNLPNFYRTILSNGLRVIVVPQEGSVATTVSVTVQAGSKYETKEISGISHFLEHMMFKGTERRPSALDISSELDGLGAQYNAFTSQEATSYYAKVTNEFFPRAFDVISDLYLNPVFRDEEIEKEKGVIIEEINMYEDLPNRKVQELFMELVYGDQPAGWSIAGNKDVIKGLKREDFVKYRNAHYTPKATVVVVSGGVSKDMALEEVSKKFEDVIDGSKDDKLEVVESQSEPRELVFHKPSDQTHMVLGFRAFDMHDDRKYALRLLAGILGGGMSSRLFQKIREELGVAYYVGASDDLYSDHGLLTVSAGVQNEKVRQVVEAVLMECERMKKELVSDDELKRVKDHRIGSMTLSLETSDALGAFYGMQEVMGMDIIGPDEVARRIRAVTAEDIQKVAGEIITSNGLNVALIGPFEGESFIDMLRV
jgi:predicted Zn-dependent peptidase